MTRTNRLRLIATAAAVAATAAVATPALAHTGTDGGVHHGLLAGALHPFTGVDHLLAMLAVGFAAAAGAGRATLVAVVFAAGMLGGALLAAAGLPVPAVEPMIAASLLAFGLLAAARRALPRPATALAAGGFAVFHGAAHAAELQASPGALAGMLAATAVLLGAGALLGRAARTRSRWWTRLAGAIPSLAGAGLLLAMAARG